MTALGAARPHHSIGIVTMRRRHLRAVLRIEARVYPRPWSASLFSSELAQVHTRAYFVARAGRTVVGYGGIMVVGDDAHVTTLAVDPDHRRRGVATRLLVELGTAARARGCTAWTLEVRRSNRAAQDLYRRFGFEAVGVRRGYYGDDGEDAIVMWARAIDGEAYAELLAGHGRRIDRRARVEHR